MKRALVVMGLSTLVLAVITVVAWHEALYVTEHGHGIIQGPTP